MVEDEQNFREGQNFEYGRNGVSRDETRARFLYEVAAARGQHPAAIMSVAGFYLEGFGGLTEDHDRAIELYQQAADLGSAEAEFQLGSLYLGWGEYDDAERWLLRSLQSGYLDASRLLEECRSLNEPDYDS